VGFVGTAMFAAGVWVAAGGRGARFDRQEELLGGLFFAAVGLVCTSVALAKWELRRPNRSSTVDGHASGSIPLVCGARGSLMLAGT
jgi:hypothetical protein